MKARAIFIERYGPPGVLAEREVELGDPGPGHVHVAVEASGVNFADLLQRAGLYSTQPPLPFVPGFEIAGRVAAVGSDVSVPAVGQRVIALLREGGHATDVIVPADQVLAYPATLTPVEAAALPVVFLTAWVCLFEAARVRPAETVLVLGAGGGVGTAAVQLARERGLTVYGTAGDERKRRFVIESLGAAACFDSRGDWAAAVRAMAGERSIDVVLDPVGGSATRAAWELLAPLGRLVFYGLSAALPANRRSWFSVARAWLATPRFHPLSLVQPCAGLFGVHLLHLQNRQDILRRAWDEILPLVLAGRVHPVVDCVLPLTRAGAVAAHEHLHARRNLGKVMLTVQLRLPPAQRAQDYVLAKIGNGLRTRDQARFLS